MAKAGIKIDLEVDASEFIKALKQLDRAKIKIRSVRPKKWWQFWKK